METIGYLGVESDEVLYIVLIIYKEFFLIFIYL